MAWHELQSVIFLSCQNYVGLSGLTWTPVSHFWSCRNYVARFGRWQVPTCRQIRIRQRKQRGKTHSCMLWMIALPRCWWAGFDLRLCCALPRSARSYSSACLHADIFQQWPCSTVRLMLTFESSYFCVNKALYLCLPLVPSVFLLLVFLWSWLGYLIVFAQNHAVWVNQNFFNN